ncbi:recombinase family protein [Nannocystis exedens]|uniref:recombinase family protein n=1 Tax=Nannocystis exedens TaxID=54 RepID=UPI000BB9FF54
MAYLRVSTEEQVAGLEGQRHEPARWAASKELFIVAVFEDKDVSGATPWAERPGLQAAIAALRAHKAGALVAAKRDKFARDPKWMQGDTGKTNWPMWKRSSRRVVLAEVVEAGRRDRDRRRPR